MALEIEKKYLVNTDTWQNLVESSFLIQQGYFTDSDGIKKRIRLIDNEKAILGVKSQGIEENGFVKREENEKEINFSEGLEMFNRLNRFISKQRHIISIQKIISEDVLNNYPTLHDLKVEVDVFLNLNRPLTMAEIEVSMKQVKDFNQIASFLPTWFHEDVTLDENYSNSKLIKLTPKLDERKNKLKT